MSGGSLGINFELNTTLTFNVDPAITSAATAPPTALSLVPPTINLCARATGTVPKFTARFGFTDVNVSTDNPATSGTTETAKVHACASVAFTDPDSVGGITMDEWTSHALTELATAHIVKGNLSGNDLDTTFYVDATLVDGDAFTDGTAADASIAFTDATLVDGFNPTPAPTLGALAAWQNITAGDVANGLAEFVSSLSDAQKAGNGPLPLLKKSIADTFDGVKPLLDYTELLTNATVGCGTEPGDPTHFPTGFTDNLATGTLVYCRASTQQKKVAGTVVWAPPTGVTNVSATCATDCVNTSGAGADATLGAEGASPTADAVFKMTAPGNFTIELTWDATAGVTRKAIPRPGSAQELFQRLAGAGGLTTSLANLGYSSSSKSLTFRLQKTNFDPPFVALNASIGDLLRNATNIAGLKDIFEGSDSTNPSCYPINCSFKAQASDIDFDVTFGVLLTPNTSDITPLSGTATGGSSGTTLEDTSANFTNNTNDPRLGQTLQKTSAPADHCTIAAVALHTITCAAGSGITWSSGDTYDVDGGLLDRFYVKVDNGASAPELSVGGLDVTGTLDLDGKVGFVDVQAGGNGDKNTFSPGTAFGVTKADASKPVLRVDIKTPDPFVAGGTTIPDAIGVGELLFNLNSAHISTVCNLKATAGLGISASVEGKVLASGGVAVNWPTVFKANSCEPDFSTLKASADSNFDLSLRDFDPFPSVSGTHTGSTDTQLFDGTKNFKNVGFDPAGSASPEHGDNLLNLKLRNKTTGASCTILTIDNNSLGCSARVCRAARAPAIRTPRTSGTPATSTSSRERSRLPRLHPRQPRHARRSGRPDRPGAHRQGDPAHRHLDEGSRREDQVHQADDRRAARRAARRDRLHRQPGRHEPCN